VLLLLVMVIVFMLLLLLLLSSWMLLLLLLLLRSWMLLLLLLVLVLGGLQVVDACQGGAVTHLAQHGEGSAATAQCFWGCHVVVTDAGRTSCQVMVCPVQDDDTGQKQPDSRFCRTRHTPNRCPVLL